jgi:two-component system nitrate/nitrite response regulator NarP
MTRLLLADDHPIILSGIKSVLHGSRYEIVVTVSDGAAAIDAIAAARPDILLLDLRMPRYSGLDVLRTLRSRGDNRPVILITANLNDTELMEAIRLEINGIILKESAQETLMCCLDRVSSGGRWIEPDLLHRALDLTMVNGGTVQNRANHLSAKERAIVKLVAQGRRNREIAATLHITEGTVKVYLHRLYQRLGIANRTELAIYAQDMDSN